MKVDQKTVAAHRGAMLEQAGRLFRQRGVTSVTVADITGAAGLTHGGFYGHFASKTALAAETCRYLMEGAAARWRRRAAAAKAAGDDPIDVLIDAYLTSDKRDRRDRSCAIASLGSEVSRDPDLLPAVTAGVLALVTVLAELIAERRPDARTEAHERAALAAFSAMNGGLNLARTLADDPKRSAAALEAAACLAKQATAQGI